MCIVGARLLLCKPSKRRPIKLTKMTFFDSVVIFHSIRTRFFLSFYMYILDVIKSLPFLIQQPVASCKTVVIYHCWKGILDILVNKIQTPYRQDRFLLMVREICMFKRTNVNCNISIYRERGQWPYIISITTYYRQ